MKNFINQHKAIEVLLGRYVRKTRNERTTLNGFVKFVLSHRDLKTQFKSFGVHRLRRVVSHALESGAYSDYRLSKGEGIVANDYAKQIRMTSFTPTEKQTERLGL